VTYNVRNIAIAVVMAIAAAAVVLVYTTSYRQSVTKGQKRVDVMVASRDIVAGTPAEEAAGAMVLTSVLSDDKAPGALSTTAGLDGKVAAQTIYAGQQVVAAAFGTSTTQAPALQITKDERAVNVTVQRDSGMIGDVKAGDYIDVFATIFSGGEGDNSGTGTGNAGGAGALPSAQHNGADHLSTGGERVFTRRLLTKVRVLAVPEDEAKVKGGLSKGAKNDDMIVTLAVSQADAAKIAFTQNAPDTAKLWFAVRPPEAVAQDQPLTIETIESMIADGESPAELKKKYAESLKLVYAGGQ
jgi:Flp pilus assembly protein CpaB